MKTMLGIAKRLLIGSGLITRLQVKAALSWQAIGPAQHKSMLKHAVTLPGGSTRRVAFLRGGQL